MTIPNREKGFTLIELMVAVGVLAIVAAIALPAYRGYIATAKRSECMNEMSAIQLAEEEFFLENNNYFSGERKSGTNTLNSNSSGLYAGTFDTTDNCRYEVTTGTNTYTLTVTGINDLSSEGTIETFTK